MSEPINTAGNDSEFVAIDDSTDVVAEKLMDALTPGYQVEFDPLEAERAGAFQEDALSEADAADSAIDGLESEEGESTPGNVVVGDFAARSLANKGGV